jgi:nitrate/nitrite-specific signal transduction histidine kinase
LRLTVADDGEGFDEALLSSQRDPGHFGVQSMMERIERLGGELALRSRPGEGTRVVLSVPASVAYRKPSQATGLGTPSWWRARGRSAGRD